MSYVRQMMEDERGYADAVWNKMAELGWMGLIAPEEYGGAGLSLVDLAVVLEEMGKVVLPGPLFFRLWRWAVCACRPLGVRSRKRRCCPVWRPGRPR